jgi:hypothetical protein
MKTLQTLALATLCSIFVSCHTATDTNESAQTEKVYNVAVILDGTDRIQNSSAISQVSTAELTDLAQKIAENGTGSLFVSYVDRDCSNNHFALFEINQLKPRAPEKKKEHVMQSNYDQQMHKYEDAIEAYNENLTQALERFSCSCNKIVAAAYSNEVATERNGSDVKGALSKALRAIAANDKAETSHIILISDCIHNAQNGKLEEVPDSVELITVNTNDGGDLKGLITKQCLTFSQITNYIF